MSSKKDLVEAHAFNRRRLVTAFVSGAPGGREVEPVRYGRTLVGGLVLAALVVAAAAVLPILKPGVPQDWLSDGMVVGKTTGSRFLVYRKTLYPIINTTSARLILAASGDFKVTFVPDASIAAQKPGPTLGIAGAPDLLPTPSTLLPSGWTACTNTARGVKVTVATRSPAAVSRSGALVVAAKGGTWVLSGTHRYPLPSGAVGRQVLRALKLDGQDVPTVAGRWLDLMPVGHPLAPFSVPGSGTKLRGGSGSLTTVGSPVEVDGRPYVLGAKGLIPLTDLADAVYRSSGAGARLPVVRLEASQVPSSVPTVTSSTARPYPADWPSDAVSLFPSPTSPCLVLTTSSGGAPTVHLASATTSAAAAPDGTVTRSVASGHGALVQTSSAGVIGAGTTFLVDATGTRYAIGTKETVSTALKALGYGDVRPVAVPAAWTDLFADGPALTTRAAGQLAGGSQQ